MVERRRKPLVLSSTKFLVDSVLSSSRISRDDLPPRLLFPAGILRLSKDRIGTLDSTSKLTSLDDSALVGLPTAALKKLAVTCGSPVSFFLCS